MLLLVAVVSHLWPSVEQIVVIVLWKAHIIAVKIICVNWITIIVISKSAIIVIIIIIPVSIVEIVLIDVIVWWT
jgi:hypothetical protein